MESIETGLERPEYRMFVHRHDAEEHLERVCQSVGRVATIERSAERIVVHDAVIHEVDSATVQQAVDLVKAGKGRPLAPKPGQVDDLDF